VIRLAALLFFLAATPAAAQVFAPTASDGGWRVVVGAATDNRAKDASKSETDPYAFASAEWATGGGGFYIGPSIQSVDQSGADMEARLNAGVRHAIAGVSLELGVTYKQRIHANPGTDTDEWQVSLNARRKIGPVAVTLVLQASPDGLGQTERFTWVEARAAYDLTRRLRVSGGVGQRRNHANVDYVGWNAGVTWAATPKLNLDLRWYDTDAEEFGARYGDALVAGVAYRF
jgi:uncharacterized protein (TIGR02001 family)